ncbi:hypothetical protein [Polaromonas sp. JS666]|uniref:hypothetical protein n=1 Tax=Polaromonas sp. (strain JS666 / ATCC BAA-500) TaxID=296591 RepID=UPI00005366FC|nr:hypothetical protein [Polaromonas sp. JS666]ABE47260.1 hypothetical protein Bpro_5406 [Polaromonas sp. JS666]
MKYFISVEVKATGPIADLTAAIQRAFDRGAAGAFQVLVTHAPSYLVVFERESADDRTYVSKRATSPDVSVETAAMQQLAAELVEGDIGTLAMLIVSVLQDGEAQCFDYGAGAFVDLAEVDAQPATRSAR